RSARRSDSRARVPARSTRGAPPSPRTGPDRPNPGSVPRGPSPTALSRCLQMHPSPPSRGSGPNAPARASIGGSLVFTSMPPHPTVLPSSPPDVQAGVPQTQVSLSRVGVTGVEKVIRVQADSGENLYHAEFECFVDLNPRQAGVHMSRFEEIVG